MGCIMQCADVFKWLLWIAIMNIASGLQDWSHEEIGVWSERFPACSGEQQSPINIETDQLYFSRHLHAFELPGYESIPRNAHWQLHNTGHSVQILLSGDYILSEGGLGGRYKAAYMELRWGAADTAPGSEHTVDGKRFDMECQLVHYNLKYGSFDEALQQPEGIAVLAFLFKAHKVENMSFKQIFAHLQNVSYRGDDIALRPVPLLSLLPVNLNDYYRYEGSLTEPPCTQSATWTIFEDHIYVSHKQLALLRSSLYSSQPGDPPRPLVQNLRPPQPLHGRTVYSSNPEHATVFSHPLGSPLSITLAAFLGILVLLLITQPRGGQ